MKPAGGVQYGAMGTTSSKVRQFNLTFWMIALGLLAVYAGGMDIVHRWSALVFGARLCDMLIAASGVTLLVAGAWRIATRAMRRASYSIAAAGAGGFSATLFLGVWLGAIPCSGTS
jgi:hypothetical protein